MKKKKENRKKTFLLFEPSKLIQEPPTSRGNPFHFALLWLLKASFPCGVKSSSP